MRHHQDSLAGRKHMADDVRDRVGLARSWWPLDDHAVRIFQAPDNRDLVLVKGLRKEQVTVILIEFRLIFLASTYVFAALVPCLAKKASTRIPA